MLPVRKKSLLGTFVFIFAAQALLLFVPSQAQLRKIRVADEMPEFSATGADGHVFDYKHGGGKVLMVVFLSAGQKRSARAAADIERIVSEFGANAERLQVAVVVGDPNAGAYFQTKEKGSTPDFRILLDTEFKLWGKFGIIAAPTVIISDTNDTVLWVKAGYGYDFTPVIRARLNQALGIAQQIDPNDASRVKTVTNATVSSSRKVGSNRLSLKCAKPKNWIQIPLKWFWNSASFSAELVKVRRLWMWSRRPEPLNSSTGQGCF